MSKKTNVKTIDFSIALQALNAANDGITICDLNTSDYSLIYVNKAFEKMTGFKRSEVLGKNCRFLQGNLPSQPGTELIYKAMQAQKSCRVVLQNVKKDGSLFWNELSVAPIIDNENKVSHYVGIQKDVTCEINQKQQIAILSQQDRNNAMNEMALAIAHNINQPLTAIASYSHSCLITIDSETNLQEIKNKLSLSLQNIAEQAALAGKIIHDINHLVKKKKPFMEATNINLLIQETASILSDQLVGFNLDLQLQLAPELPLIITNKSRIMQIVLSLAKNSIEAFQRNNSLNPILTIQAMLAEESIAVHVRDNGPGIPKEFKNKPLGSFFSSKSVGPGTGFGICMTLIDELNGTFNIQEHSGCGTWITFTLPLQHEITKEL